jgi:Xaa-Pro aminopeptidase
VTASEIAALGVGVARSHGLEEFFYPSPTDDLGAGFMGHGMGCSYHEPPDLNLADHTVLQENMLVVLEPILAEVGVGGVKLEDAVVITNHGAERLSSCPLQNW